MLKFRIFPVALVAHERTKSAFVSQLAARGLLGGVGTSFLAWAIAALSPSDLS